MSYYNNIFDTESRFSSRNSKLSNISDSSFGSRRWNNSDESPTYQSTDSSKNDYHTFFLSNDEKSNHNTQKENHPKKDDIIIEKKSFNTLIPEEYISIQHQQIFAAAILLLIQGYKIYDIMNINNVGKTDYLINSFVNNFTVINKKILFIVKYFVLESLFFFTLPILRIPYLKFKTLYSTIIVCLLSLLNASMTLPVFSWVFLSIMSINSSKSLTISGKLIKPDNFIQTNKHYRK